MNVYIFLLWEKCLEDYESDLYDMGMYLNNEYLRAYWCPTHTVIYKNDILVPFINRSFNKCVLFNKTYFKNIRIKDSVESNYIDFIYRFIELFLDKKLDLDNYRYFEDLILQIEAFIETVNYIFPDDIICQILLGGYNNYINFK